MNDQSKSAETKDPRVEVALREYLEQVDRGEPVDREEYLARHALIADQLRSFIAAEEEVRKLAGAVAPLDRTHDSTKSLAAHGQETVIPQSVAKRNAESGGSGLTGQFGRYRIIRALGKGAMGTVYLAEDTQIERQVALKTPHFTEDPTGEQMERFFREARAAGNLRHPNICPIYDFGQIDGKHFITMAYIEGRPLSALIQPDKPQPERKILIVIRKLALALQAAHDKGIVHRDLKPANIMVDTSSEPIIMDFGLAQQVRRNEDARLTQTGNILGTPAFMSPEQVEGELDKIGPPTDQYSLGVILYELLTSELPFRGSVMAVMGQILTKEPPPPSQLRAEMDQRVEVVCLKMMAKTSSERFPSMKAVADELAAILKSPAARTLSKDQPASSPAQSPAAQSSADRMRPHAGASQVLKSLKQKAVTESDLASLEELARKCYSRRDFEQVIQIIERISEERRSAGLQALLEKARGKTDEIAFLVCEIDEADRLNDRPAALKKAEDLLKIKPGHHRARAVQEKFSGYGEGGAARIGVLDQFRRPINDGGWIPWSVLAFGLAVFAVMSGVMVVYLGKTAIVIDIKDPGIEVVVKGTTLAVTGPDKQSVKVEPGDKELKITSAGFETTTRSFSLKKGDKKTVTVSIVNKEIVARLENEILPPTPVDDGKASRSNAGNKEVATIQSQETRPRDAARGTSTVEARQKSLATPPKFFKPFLVRGEWRIENDELVQPALAADFGDGGGPGVIFGESNLSEYDFSAEVKKTGGSGGIGIQFHLLGPGHVRSFLLNGNSALEGSFVHSGRWRRDDGGWKWFKFASNQWYVLKVEVRGSTVRAYLDDVLQFESQPDTRFTHGRIGLRTQNATASFRRIRVTDPHGQMLFEGLPELPPARTFAPAKSSNPQLLTAAEIATKNAQNEFAERLKAPVVSTNSLWMKLALIPPGEFMMGSPESEPGRGGNEQQHRVAITKPFYLGVTDVTQSEFERVMGRNPSFFRNSGGESEKATGIDTSQHPVESLTWYDAVEFCNKLSENEGRQSYYRIADVQRAGDGSIQNAQVSIAGGNGYRLPTEAQWEYACRAGTTTPFSFGVTNNGTECNCSGNLPYGTEEPGPARGCTIPVGSYRPNAFGLFDMHGNVFQFCEDWFSDDYYAVAPTSDPAGPPSGTMRTGRGGCFSLGGCAYCRAALRWRVPPGTGRWEWGFRVARSFGE